MPMYSVYRKEINSFLSSLIAYIVIIVFLMMVGLFMWVIPDTSVLSYNYATLDQLFTLAPLVFLFLIPATKMRSFAEERQTGTIEFLSTKPISELEIVCAKFLANLTLVLFALLPTAIYYYSVYKLGYPEGNLDSGGIMGSYIGLFFLAAVFVAIGIFVSSITNNQIVSFILAAFLCFICYFAFGFLSNLPIFVGSLDYTIQKMGISYHYAALSKGVIDSRSVVYFLTVIFFFIVLTMYSLKQRRG